VGRESHEKRKKECPKAVLMGHGKEDVLSSGKRGKKGKKEDSKGKGRALPRRKKKKVSPQGKREAIFPERAFLSIQEKREEPFWCGASKKRRRKPKESGQKGEKKKIFPHHW